MYSKRLITLFFVSILSACSSINDIPVEKNQTNQDIATRNQQVSQLNSWTIAGKIAFINSQKRQSASLHWQRNAADKTESLNLSTLFGIKVLALTRQQDNFVLEVDGNLYNTKDLDHLIYTLTGLDLPTRAMSHWLKGLAFLATDKIDYHAKTQLPQSLTSYYNNKNWLIKYNKYHHIGPFQLAKQLTIIQGDLRIKIVIHSWKV
ncbi:lipoprotein insertase outer membrane protein LolB [Colwellia sp. C1TZA3]|uniref:lipoprotein insertase outer membrane protein LolB n=1 Tax=Colwellia sp. C1TZA3 TaxID=2508879 RepID=UPI0011B9D304|nr:lipoprotein insertase outer membrane protein LolB [Colwellia sp. C1TZA3]TWX73231.1 outer membrane lipoprotein LolB [Colwellia sp. C1TZA3]